MELFDKAIEVAKQDVIRIREEQWKRDWAIENEQYYFDKFHSRFPDTSKAPKPPDLSPHAWVIVQWSTGYIVMDSAEFIKLKKREQNKILKLGANH